MGASDRIASLDALRGGAGFAVAIAHYLAYRAVGPLHAEAASALAVEVFFTLSGFVLAPQILRCVRDGSAATLKVFLVRRWMRTVPPYLVALAAVTILIGQADTADILRYALYLQNFWGQHNAADFFPVAWSLSVEEWFYVSFPALAMAAAWIAGRRDLRLLAGVAVAYILAVSAARAFGGDFAHWGQEVRRVVAFRVDSIAYGVLLYLALAPAGRLNMGGGRRALGAGAVAIVGLIGAMHLLLQIGATGGDWAKQAFPYVAALFGSAVIVCVLALGGAIDRLRPVREGAYFLGRISYPVYLFHLPLMMILTPWTGAWPLGAEFALYLGLLTVFCAAFHTLFEQPILAARPRYASARRADLGPAAAVQLAPT